MQKRFDEGFPWPLLLFPLAAVLFVVGRKLQLPSVVPELLVGTGAAEDA